MTSSSLKRSVLDEMFLRSDEVSKLENEVMRADLHADNRERLEATIQAYKKLPRNPRKTIQTSLARDISRALMLYTRCTHVDRLGNCVIFDSHREMDTLLLDEAMSLLQDWRTSIRKGDRIECQDWSDEYEGDDEELGWIKSYKARVERFVPGGNKIYSTNNEGSENEKEVLFDLEEGHPGALYVHFDGFDEDDKWVKLTEDHIMPEGTREQTISALDHFQKHRMAILKRRINVESVSIISNQMQSDLADGSIPIRRKKNSPRKKQKLESKPKQIQLDEHIASEQEQPTILPENTNSVEQSALTKVQGLPTSRPKVVIKKTKKKKKTKKQIDDSPALICVECTEAECSDNPKAPFIRCTGECLCSFHYPCAGVELNSTELGEWVCSDCVEKRHKCGVCGEYGDDKKDVFVCSKDNCGLFYHMNCLAMFGIEADINEDLSFLDDKEESQGSPLVEEEITFQCPAHECLVCIEASFSNRFPIKGGDLIRCLECPNSYHFSCIPPAARFHELGFLCPDHRCGKLPFLDLENSEQMAYERIVDAKKDKVHTQWKKEGKDVIVRDGVVKIDASGGSGFIPLNANSFSINLPIAVRQAIAFRLPINFRDDVNSRPPSFKSIPSLKYGSEKPKRLPPHEGGNCHCVPRTDGERSCGDTCLNKISMIECVGGPTKFGNSGEKNKYWNCDCGPECGNRRISKREVARCKLKLEGGKGWGLVAIDGVRKGDLVIEYIGEVINEKTKNTRLEEWTKEHPNDPNFYIMELQAGWFIDAREYGNLSRFINHGCDPNCKLIPMNVAGYMRIGIFCTKDVAPGGFLSYDYRFDTKDGSKFGCLCGAEKCRGTMKGGEKKGDCNTVEKKTKKQLRSEAKEKLDRDLKFLEEYEKESKTRLNMTNMVLPGAHKESTDLVINGPKKIDMISVRQSRIFLWRNVLKTWSMMKQRYTRCLHILDDRQAPYSETICDLPKVDVISVINSRVSVVTEMIN